MPDGFVNQLHFGDNLVRLRGDAREPGIPDEIADLIYLDPPFNSARNYNLLFKQHKGQDSPAQIMTFEDTWTYSHQIMHEFKADGRNAPLFELMDSLFKILGPSEMMAYLLMMAPRLLELHGKLKKTGSLYLHCDPVASHYLKVILDVIFGPQFFRNEIVWKRSSAHNDTRQGMKRLGKIHDIILFYTKSDEYRWNPQYTEFSSDYIASAYNHLDKSGRRYQLDNLTAAKPGGDVSYDWRVMRKIGTDKWEPDLSDSWRTPDPNWEYHAARPYKGRYWAYSKENMRKFAAEGRLYHASSGVPRYIRFLDEMPGVSLQDLWTDIVPPGSKERRGYPTQKPLALLERIIAASTDEGDVVLDPFAGCGTSIVAAERMKRKWIGIDITYLAINEVIARLQTEKVEGKELVYNLLGTPKDESSAVALFKSTEKQNHKPFEQWAVTLVKGRFNDKKGADRGIDGVIDLHDMQGNYKMGVIQVKGGNGLNLSNVRDFANVIESSKAVFGIMIAQKEPTKEMKLVADAMGYADWPGSTRIPRYQIVTTEGILERGEMPIIPISWLIQAQKGVGKAAAAEDQSLFGDED